MNYNINYKGQILFNGTVVPENEPNNPLFLDYRDYLRSGGSVEPLEYDHELAEHKRFQIRLEYSNKISSIVGMREAVERFIIDSTPIPAEILAERDRLKAEYATQFSS